MSRTADEILARIEQVKEDDFWGFRQDVLLNALPWERIAPLLDEDSKLTEAEWAPWAGEVLETEAREYLTFAIGKITRHKGISASRSVDKLTEFAWLMGRDDVVTAMGEAEYTQYGAPIVAAFAAGMGWPFLDAVTGWERDALRRMAAGLPCRDECMDGCAL